MMQFHKSQEQIDADYKYFEESAAAEKVSTQDISEISKRHKKYKQRAKNLAGLKGADKNALLYERLMLKNRIEEIDNHLISEKAVRCSNGQCWIDEGIGCSMGEINPKDCNHYQNSFT